MNFSGEFDETTDEKEVLAAYDRDDQREQRRYRYVVARGQVTAQNNFQQTRRRQREWRRGHGQRRCRRHVDQQ